MLLKLNFQIKMDNFMKFDSKTSTFISATHLQGLVKLSQQWNQLVLERPN